MLRRSSRMKPAQPSLFKTEKLKAYTRLEHGGTLRRGKRKLIRPIDPKRPVHVVLKSSRARGHWSLLTRDQAIRNLIRRFGQKFEVELKEYANAGNHLHLL